MYRRSLDLSLAFLSLSNICLVLVAKIHAGYASMLNGVIHKILLLLEISAMIYEIYFTKLIFLISVKHFQ